jgi:uncharacterized SAM-binding protein YcdF (DUF218 family)
LKTGKLLILASLVLGGVLYFSSSFWMPSIANFLVDSVPPSKADAVVVLAGDWLGLRVEKGGDLVREGWAPVALLSGPHQHYGKCESDLAIDWAATKGYPRNYFEGVPNFSTSTEDEAAIMAAEIRKRGIRKILLVTSNYHTRRAGKIWRRAAAGAFEVQVVAAPDKDLVPEAWWKNREGRKKIFLEWVKTITGPLGA